MNIILNDDLQIWQSLLPLTFAKPISALRIGILTLQEKWMFYFPNSTFSYRTQPHLEEKFPLITASENLYLHSAAIPTDALARAIQDLKIGQKLMWGNIELASRVAPNQESKEVVNFDSAVKVLTHPWEIFGWNAEELISDFAKVTAGRKSQPITDIHTKVYGAENIFLEPGVTVTAAILNALEGPIYLGRNSVVHEGAIVKGSCSLGEESHINMGAKLRGANTIGPYSKVGGEISNSVIQGYSNKGHDGFLGNSVIGEWCNLGADTNTSNLKNNYGEVSIYSYLHKKPVNTGLQFCGLIMGDHSKAGINTMFNTGTVVGFCTSIFGGGFPPKHIPSYSWCDGTDISDYEMDKAIATAKRVFARRNMEMTEQDEKIFHTLNSAK